MGRKTGHYIRISKINSKIKKCYVEIE